MSKSYLMSVEVPEGKYCATKQGGYLYNRCPLLLPCQTCIGAFYCSVVNSDTHLGQDEIGIIKHRGDPVWYACPSTYEEDLRELYKKART